MEKHVISNIPGIELYPVVSLVLFFAIFAGLVIWYFAHDRKQLEILSRAPLDEGTAVEELPTIHTINV